MLPVAITTPINLSESKNVIGKLWEKQILPIGSINYKGRKLRFTKKYLTDLAESFRSQAYDQVPIQLATAENAHNMDPTLYGGEVVDLVVKNDGLYSVVRPTKEASTILSKNPKLGVSARIVEGLEKSDGRTFDRAIQHVLLTMDPRVTGMKPWQTVDLSNIDQSERPVIDLTTFEFERENNMANRAKAILSPKKKPSAPTRSDADIIEIDLSALSDEEYQTLISLSTESDEDATEDEDLDEDLDEDEDDSEDEDDEDDDEEEDVNLSNKSKKKSTKDLSSKKASRRTINLSTVALAGARGEQVDQMRIDLAQAKWERERDSFAQAGVPPFLLDLAEPVLSSPDSLVIDLSNTDEPVDASKVVRDLLNGVKGMVDLSEEIGHSIDLSADDKDPDKEILDAWDAEYSG